MALIRTHTKRSLSPWFSPSCPKNAAWYACPRTSKSTFVGCCSLNPCDTDTGCALNNLEPASFNATVHGTSDFPPDPDCGSKDINAWSCLGSYGSTFWGCCKSNPCRGPEDPPVCGAGNLTQSYLKTDEQYNSYQTENSSVTSSYSTSTSTPSANSNGNGGVNVGLIAGVAVSGAVIVIAMIVFLIFCMRKRRRTRELERNPNVASATSGTTGFNRMDYRGSAMSEVPPTYYSPNPNNPSELSMAGQPYKTCYAHVAYAPTELAGQPSPRAEMPVSDSQHLAFVEEAASRPISPASGNPSEVENAISSISHELVSPPMTPPLPSTTSGEARSAEPT